MSLPANGEILTRVYIQLEHMCLNSTRTNPKLDWIYHCTRFRLYKHGSADMENPWKLKPRLICAPPIAGGLLQIIILRILMERAASVHRNTINYVIIFLVLSLLLASLPAMSAAVGGLKTNAIRGWYAAGVVLNAVYCLLPWVPNVSMVTRFVHEVNK